MALILTLIAIGVGVVLGIRWGGELSNVPRWHPVAWEALLVSLALTALVDLVGIKGGFGAFLYLAATAALLAFAVINVRVGGMVVVAAGVGLNFLVTLLNWGRPVSGAALVRAGIVEQAELATTTLTGGRSIADGAILGFLGDVVPLPWGQVISIGDLLMLAGIVLVTASVLRNKSVGTGRSPYSGRYGAGGYDAALAALGRGPAPRRGPGLHPSRLSGGRAGRRPHPGRRPR